MSRVPSASPLHEQPAPLVLAPNEATRMEKLFDAPASDEWRAQMRGALRREFPAPRWGMRLR